MLEGVAATQEEQVAPELVLLEMRLPFRLVGRSTVDGEYIDVDALEELEVGPFEYGGRSVFNLGEGIGIGRVGLGTDDLIGLRQPLAPVPDELLIVRARHADVHVVVPGNESLMAHSPEHGACPQVVAQVVLAAHTVHGLQISDDFPLEDADVVVGLVMQSHSSSLNSISRFF